MLISNKSSIYYSCGTDPNYLKVREQLNYFPFDESEKYTKRRIDFHNWFIKNVDVIVPATYSYAVGYKTIQKGQPQSSFLDQVSMSNLYLEMEKRKDFGWNN